MSKLKQNFNPYKVIRSRYVTEKSAMLAEMKNEESNRSLSAFKSDKVTFVVAMEANKVEIAQAVQMINPAVKVSKVNTIKLKGKQVRRRGQVGKLPALKKAIVTLKEGSVWEDKA